MWYGILGSQDGGIGRPWFYLLHSLPNITTIYRAAINETDMKTSRKYFPHLKI